MNGVPRWKPRLENYQGDEVSQLTFPSAEDMHAAIDLVWVGKLLGMPFNLGSDGESLVVPKQGIPFFTKAGIRFVQTELKSK